MIKRGVYSIKNGALYRWPVILLTSRFGINVLLLFTLSRFANIFGLTNLNLLKLFRGHSRSLEIQRVSTEIFHYRDKVQSKKEKAPKSDSQSSLTQTCEFTCCFPDKLTLLVYFEWWFRIFEELLLRLSLESNLIELSHKLFGLVVFCYQTYQTVSFD